MKETNVIGQYMTRSENMIIDGASVKINFTASQPPDVYRNIERILQQTTRFGVKKAHKQ